MKLSIKEGKSGKVHIYIDDEYKLTVDSTFWFSEKWHKLKEIDSQELAALETAVNSRRAFSSGFMMLSRRAHGKKELMRKLMLKHSQQAAQAACDRLEEIGLLDDADFADRLCDELFEKKKYSPKRIKMELITRGIDREIAENAVQKLDKNDLIRIILLLQTKYRNYLSDEKGVKRAINGLMRMGYGYGDIKKALAQLSCDTEEEFYE